MHTTILMRSGDLGLPDLPPASFDFTADDFSHSSLPEAQPPAAPTELASTVRRPIKIARAIAGTSEIRLLRQLTEGQSDTFILEHACLQPYKAQRVALVKTDAPHVPMSEEEAHEAYASAVKEAYPAEKLHNGREVAIHHELLK